MTFYTATSLFSFLACVSFSPFVLLKGRKNRQTYLFGILTLLAGTWSLFPFATGLASNAPEAIRIARLVYFFALFVPPVFLHLTFAILDLPKAQWERSLLKVSYLISILFILVLPTDLFIVNVIRFAPFFGVVPGPFYTAYVLFFGMTCAIGFIKLLQGYKKAAGVSKNQLRYIFVSWFFAYVAGLLHFMPAYFGFEPFPHDILLILFVPISAYAIVRYRLLDIRIALTRLTIFAIAYVFVLGVPFFVGYSGQDFLSIYLGRLWWLVPLTLCAFFASLGPSVYLDLKRRTEGRLLAEQHRYQAVLHQASQGMTLVKDLDRLLKRTVGLITREVRLKHAAIYLWDNKAQCFTLEAARQWKTKEPVTLTKEDPLLEYLRWHRAPVVTDEIHLQVRSGQAQLQPIFTTLKALDAAVLVPSFVEDRCLGFLVLGEKRSGAIYMPDDLRVFQILADQAALAIENAQFYEELKRTQADLFQTAKMASLGHMAGGMSHQINNRFHVLTVLAGVTRDALKSLKTLDPAKQEELWQRTIETFDKIEQNALRGGDIVKTLLKFSRPTGDFQAITLPQILATAREVVQYRVDMNRIDFVQEIPEGLPAVKGSVNLLADSMFNLITNAYDAIQRKAELLTNNQLPVSPKDPSPYRGQMSIKARLDRTGDKEWVVVEMHDNGIGMTPQDLENLFIPFFTTKATVEKGTGLGLYIIQRIVEQHGGTIVVASAYGEGTTFTIRLPVAEEKANA